MILETSLNVAVFVQAISNADDVGDFDDSGNFDNFDDFVLVNLSFIIYGLSSFSNGT